MPQRKRATIREGAQATGLSPAAVSYAPRGMQGSEGTQGPGRKGPARRRCEADPIARPPARGKTAGEVVSDNRRGVTMALEHLHGLGHRHIAVLTPTRESTPDRPAEVHVSAEAERLGLDVDIVTAPHALDPATAVALDVLSRT